MTTRTVLLQKLRDRLANLEQSRLNNNDSLCFELKDLDSKDKITQAREILDKYGILFVTEAITNIEVEKIKTRIVSAHNKMFGDGMHDISVTKVEEIPEKAKAGIHGNKGFGYLYKQPLAKEETQILHISGKNVYVEHNPIFRHVNLETLISPENRQMLAVLLALTHYKKVMVSHDSCKVSTNYKSKANPFTVPHHDFYSDQTQRRQVILNPIENRTKLYYTPGTLDSEVKNLLVQLQIDPNFYTTDGFKAIKEDVAQILRPYMLAPPPRSLTFWKSGIAHAEYTSEPQPNKEGLFNVGSGSVGITQLTNQLVVRLVIGTHIPQLLSDDTLKQLAIAVEYDLITNRYLHGNHTAVVLNKMHKGKTQYMKRRIASKKEKDLLKEAIEKAEDLNNFSKIDPLLQHLYGIPLDEKNYPLELKKLV